MKLIHSTDETVTLQFSRAEVRDLWDALGDAITLLEGGREEETADDLKHALKRAERLLPKVYDLTEGLSKIVLPSAAKTNMTRTQQK